MSLILDALRKMELERKARRHSSHELRSEVLNYRGAAPVYEKPRLVLIAVAVVIFSVSAAGVYYVTRPEPSRSDNVRAAVPLKQEQLTVVPQQPAQLQPSPPLLQKTQPAAVKNPPEVPATTAKTVNARKSSGEGIIVSGIAWQDERSLRRAVINGALVGEGAEISGAKVVEIRENRVRFSRDGEAFEVDYASGSGR